MQRIFTSGEVLQIIRDRIAEDITYPFDIKAVEIHVEQPFENGQVVHNGVPALVVHFRLKKP